MPESLRLIKKYPNRRLYDTKTSAYITLNDVKGLVLSIENFKVVDAKTGEDLTRSILLQIVLEEESSGTPLFETALLAQMIRLYGHSAQAMLGKFLELNIKSFTEFQKRLKDQSSSLQGETGGQLPSDMWARFISFHGPALQTVMNNYLEQSRRMLPQAHEPLRSQAQPLPKPPGLAPVRMAGDAFNSTLDDR